MVDLPFTEDEFFDVFEDYNNDVWPIQVILYSIGILALLLAFKKTKYFVEYSDRVIVGILAFLWLWMGIIYHWIYFTDINNSAYLFGGLFIIQGILFLLLGVVKQDLSFNFELSIYSIVGAIFILYGLVIYPILGYLLGHEYPRAPIFGVPCPTTIFTFGLLLWTDKKFPYYILVIPLTWSFIGFTAAIFLDVLQDTMLLIAGILGTAMIVYRDKTEVG